MMDATHRMVADVALPGVWGLGPQTSGRGKRRKMMAPLQTKAPEPEDWLGGFVMVTFTYPCWSFDPWHSGVARSRELVRRGNVVLPAQPPGRVPEHSFAS